MKQRPSGESNLGLGRLRNLKPRIFSQPLSREAACSITLDRFSDIALAFGVSVLPRRGSGMKSWNRSLRSRLEVTRSLIFHLAKTG